MNAGPILYCGDPHGRFRHIIDAAERTKASAVVLLGDMEPRRALHIELTPLVAQAVPIHFIHGNHDADSDQLWVNVWASELTKCNVHGRVVELPNGQRLAGLGGVFQETTWYPTPLAPREGAPAYQTMGAHAASTPRQNRWRGKGPPRKHWAGGPSLHADH